MIGQVLDPVYLSLMDSPDDLSSEQLDVIRGTRCRSVFVSKERRRLWKKRGIPGVGIRRRFYEWAPKWELDIGKRPCIPMTNGGGTFGAAGIAAYLGAKRVFLAGVDDFGGRFAGREEKVAGMYERLAALFAKESVELLNLSSRSLLTLPVVDQSEVRIDGSVAELTDLRLVSDQRRGPHPRRSTPSP